MPISVLSIAFAALVLGAVSGALAARALKASRRSAAEAAAMDNLLRQVDQTSRALNGRLDAVTGEMNRTFAHALQQATQSLTGTIGTVREETRAAISEKFVQVTERLGDLKATNERIMEFSRSLDEFQRMLQSPKLRGDFGEFTLEQMLRDLLPAEHWESQAPIGSTRVDALIRTPYGALCIDCKFPLDNFRRALAATEPAARDAALKLFYADVRARIDEVADRYVAPPVTLDMAFMFVPAENVYYELIGRPELSAYARQRKVVPVSPNTMYAYIQVLAVGFRGMKIQDEARRVQEILADLGTRFGRFQDHFNMIGKHLENAKMQFDRALRDVERFEATLEGVKIGRLEEIQQPLLDPDDSV
ncbi:MAG TPA: DNA recombination protein RmuC [Vicinamibacterales bacterium]|jgi:DNA recombination protein RmuC|nr:DNA recombination protein RmuC [Vicinamibacterales bacterium]